MFTDNPIWVEDHKRWQAEYDRQLKNPKIAEPQILFPSDLLKDIPGAPKIDW